MTPPDPAAQARLADFARFMREAGPLFDIAFDDRTDQQWAVMLAWLPYMEGTGPVPAAREATT